MIKSAVCAALAMLLWVGVMSSEAQTTFVVCKTAGGNEITVQGKCPPGTYFIRYLQ